MPADRAGAQGRGRPPLAAAAEGPAVDLAGAAVRYGALEALGPTRLTVRAGERIAVVGPSGAGKTTLLRLVATALAPSHGSVRVLGEEVAALGAARLRALRA